jgi:hypothetical protein
VTKKEKATLTAQIVSSVLREMQCLSAIVGEILEAASDLPLVSQPVNEHRAKLRNSALQV